MHASFQNNEMRPTIPQPIHLIRPHNNKAYNCNIRYMIMKSAYKYWRLPRLAIFSQDCIIKLIQRRELFLVNQIKLVNEQEEVPVARVQMRFNSQRAYMVEVVAVYMRIDPEEPTHNGAYCVAEISGKRYANLVWENVLVVKNALRPVHQGIDVVRGGKLRWSLVLDSVLPEILVSWSCRHDRALLRCTELGDGAVQHVEMIEEVNRVDSKPFVGILAFR